MIIAHLNDTETEHWRSDVANPHASKHSNTHASKEYSPRLGSCFAQGEGSHHLCDVVLAKCCCDGEATKQQHDHRRPHGGKDVGCSCLGSQSSMRFDILSHHLEHDDQEWDE
jgi:hypothetical protein